VIRLGVVGHRGYDGLAEILSTVFRVASELVLEPIFEPDLLDVAPGAGRLETNTEIDALLTLGGDGTQGSPNTGWPRYDRIAVQPAPYVAPDQVSWFQFTVQAPTTPGTYKLYLRPLIEGAAWMEDFGVFWVVTVK